MAWTDYANLSVYRSGLNNEEFTWIDTRHQNLPDKVVKKIKKIYKEFDFDTSKMVRNCTDVKYDFNFD